MQFGLMYVTRAKTKAADDCSSSRVLEWFQVPKVLVPFIMKLYNYIDA
ncbi:hypothetical protein A2U01_0041212, partial [Trifolium medium]|nr:hypothetical protein [Trifolium medium]